MTALLEIKQNIKRFYGQYEVYILPVLKFVLAFAYFLWINSNMGYMKQLDNIFIVLILALVCSILPVSVMMFMGFALMMCDGYVGGIERDGLLCSRDRNGRIYAASYSVDDDPVPQIQQVTESCNDPYTTFFRIWCSCTYADRSRPAGQRIVSASGRMRCCDLLFYTVCTCAVGGTQ